MQSKQNGIIMNKHERQQQAFVKKMQKIRDKNLNCKAYIIKGGYYYRSDFRGYSEFKLSAGVYDIIDACNHVTSCSFTDFIRIVPIDKSKHNNDIAAEIKRLSNNFIL